MNGWLFALLGALVGAVQAGLLARTVGIHPQPVLTLLRLVLVGGVLLLSALAGHLVAGAAGWLTGFAVAGMRAHRRLR